MSVTTRQHHGTSHTPRRQTSRDLDRASQAFLSAPAHHRDIFIRGNFNTITPIG